MMNNYRTQKQRVSTRINSLKKKDVLIRDLHLGFEVFDS